MATVSPDRQLMRRALEEAKESLAEGGIPIGAVLAEGDRIVASGHNRRIQHGDPTAHGEIDCLRRAGRRKRYDGVTLYTTLSPCMMCSGAIIQFAIPRVVIGDAVNFQGNIDLLRERGVDVTVLNDEECVSLMHRFIVEHPEIWDEDIAGNEAAAVT